ncbi:hypothetical protein ACOMHN_011239 [Nucella lapillus]
MKTKAVGVDIPDHAIDRSHRVGRQGTDRAVLVKFASYKYKQAFLKARSGLSKVDGKKLFPALDWPTAPVSGSQRSAGPSARRLYVNEDLTRIRADVARRARALKKAGKISDTWCRNGITFVKKGGENQTMARLCQTDATRQWHICQADATARQWHVSVRLTPQDNGTPLVY